MDFSITSPDLDRLIKLFEQSPQITGEELHRAMQASVLIVEGEVVKRTPVDTGRLRGAITSHIEGYSSDITGITEVNQVAYSVPVEVGSRPHWPPRAALEDWVSRKFQLSDPVEIRRAAFLVARAISRRGTKAHNMFKDGAKAAEPRVHQQFEQAAERVAERLSK